MTAFLLRTVSARPVRQVAAAVAALVVLSVHAPGIAAQTPTIRVAREWLPFAGCWATATAMVPGPMVCLAVTDNPNVVEMLTVSGDAVTSSTTLDLSGRPVRFTREGCSGTEVTKLGANSRTIYTNAEFTCDGGDVQHGSSAFTMLAQDAFSRVEGLKTKSSGAVRIVDFTAVTPGTNIPMAIANRIPSNEALAVQAARTEAAAPLTPLDIIDASLVLEDNVLSAVVAGRRQTFTLSARDIRGMRDAGVGTPVIDMMIAVSNPRQFQLASGSGPQVKPASDPFGNNRLDPFGLSFDERRLIARLRATNTGMLGGGFGAVSSLEMEQLLTMYPFLANVIAANGFGFANRGGLWGNGFWNQQFGPWGFNNFGFNNGFNGGFNNGFNNGWIPGDGPIVIVPNGPSAPGRPADRVVKGEGYYPGSTVGDRSAGPRGESSAPSPSVNSGGGSQGGGSSSSGSSSGSSPSGGGGARTAIPRPPR